MRTRVICSGHADVALPPDEAFPLFTPEGERLWVEGWAPRYPEGGAPSAARGLVFITDKDEGDALWTVTRFDADALAASYTCLVPGHRATLIDVDLEPGPSGGTRVRVRYDMTALDPSADGFVEAFARGFQDFMGAWEAALERHILDGEPLP